MFNAIFEKKARGLRSAGLLLSLGLIVFAAIGVFKTTASDDSARQGAQPAEVSAAPYGPPPASAIDAFGGKVTLEAAFVLTSPHASFGGLSGLWVAADGARMIAVSDAGQRWQASLSHDDTGRLTGLDEWVVADLPRRPGEDGSSPWIDAEELSGDGRGGLIVAYEGEHRLRRWRLDDLDATPEPVPLPALVRKELGGPSNSGMEALSTLPGARLFTVGERVGAWGGEGLMAWAIDGERAEELIYIQGKGFAPTGADRLDDTVFVVERSFSLLGGFRNRIVSFEADAVSPGARIEGRELAVFRWGDIGENFEGLAARRAPDGRILLYLLADDNFSFLQDTLMLQLSLPPENPTN